MTKASDNVFPKLIISQAATPAAPSSTDEYKLFVDSADGHLKHINSSSDVVDLEAAATGNVAADAIWDAKGDLAVGTGANTAAKLTVGANNLAVIAASGEATGLKYAAVPLIVYKSGTEIDLTNTTTETDLLPNTSLPGGSLGSHGKVHVHIVATVTHNVNGTCTIKLYYGSSLFLSLALAQGATTAVKATVIDLELWADGATDAQHAQGRSMWYDATTGLPTVKWAGGTGTVDSTSAQDIRVTATWGAANAGLIFAKEHISAVLIPG